MVSLKSIISEITTANWLAKLSINIH